MAFDKDSDWWPSFETPEKAVYVMKLGSAAAAFGAVLTAVVGIVSIYSDHPVLGMDGSALIDAALFSIVAWRVYRLSLPWAIVGLVTFSVERLFAFMHNPHLLSGGVIGTVVFFPIYLNAVRGGLYLRNSRMGNSAPAIPARDPFEAKPVVDDRVTRAAATEDRSPQSSHEEYIEFLAYVKRGRRKFQRTGGTIQEEFAAWLKHHRKRRVAVPAR